MTGRRKIPEKVNARIPAGVGFSSLDLFFDNRYSVVIYDRVIRRCAMKKDLLLALRSGEELTLRQQTLLALQLSIPAILAQVSSIAMQ